MIEWATAATVIVLGPGAIAVFVWFLFDLKRIFAPPSTGEEPPVKE